MAVLDNNDGLTLRIDYAGWERGWLYHHVGQFWRDEPVLNDAILKPVAEAPRGCLALCEEGSDCGLLALLDRVIETGEPDHRNLLEPWIELAIFPYEAASGPGVFPFLPSKMRLIYKSERARDDCLDREARRRATGMLDDDLVVVMRHVDLYNSKGCNAMDGRGPLPALTVNWSETKGFHASLRTEFEALPPRGSFAWD